MIYGGGSQRISLSHKNGKTFSFFASCMPNMKRPIIFEQQSNYNNNIEMKKKISKQSERLNSSVVERRGACLKC